MTAFAPLREVDGVSQSVAARPPPRQIGDGAPVAAVDASGSASAHRACAVSPVARTLRPSGSTRRRVAVRPFGRSHHCTLAEAVILSADDSELAVALDLPGEVIEQAQPFWSPRVPQLTYRAFSDSP
jgi:hypothetical protein